MKEFIKNNLLFSLLALYLVLILASFLFIVSTSADNIRSISITFLTTFLSVILAITLSIIAYNYQEEQKDEREMNKLKTNLKAEITDILDVLRREDFLIINNGLRFKVTYIQPIIIEECVRTDLFNSRQTENLLHIARKIRFYNTQIEYLLNLLAHPKNNDFESLISHCERNLTQTINCIIKNLDQMKNQLGIK